MELFTLQLKRSASEKLRNEIQNSPFLAYSAIIFLLYLTQLHAYLFCHYGALARGLHHDEPSFAADYSYFVGWFLAGV
jgi:hypothetical protein